MINILISSQIHAQNLTRSGGKRFAIHKSVLDMEFVRSLASLSAVLGLERRAESGERRAELKFFLNT